MPVTKPFRSPTVPGSSRYLKQIARLEKRNKQLEKTVVELKTLLKKAHNGLPIHTHEEEASNLASSSVSSGQDSVVGNGSDEEIREELSSVPMNAAIDGDQSDRTAVATTNYRQQKSQSGQSVCSNISHVRNSNFADQDIVHSFLFEVEDGESYVEDLALIRNRQSLRRKHWYLVDCTLYAMYQNIFVVPRVVVDSLGGGSLIARTYAEDLGWKGSETCKDCQKGYDLLGNSHLSVLGQLEVRMFLNKSHRWVWIELDVVDDEDLPMDQWQVLLGQRASRDAGLLIEGPSNSAPSRHVQDWHSPFVSNPVAPMTEKPKPMPIE